MHPDRANRRHQDQLDPAVPHLDLGNLKRAGAEQWRLGIQRIEIAHDRNALRDHRAIVQLENGRLPARILIDEIGCFLLALRDRDLLRWQVDTLLRREDTHSARIGGRIGAVVE